MLNVFIEIILSKIDSLIHYHIMFLMYDSMINFDIDQVRKLESYVDLRISTVLFLMLILEFLLLQRYISQYLDNLILLCYVLSFFLPR